MSVSRLVNARLAVVAQPWTPVFQRELARKSNLWTLVGVTAASPIGLILSYLVCVMLGNSPAEFKGLASVWVPGGTPPPFGKWTLLVPAGVVLGFYDFEIVHFIFARLLGRRASFGTQAYVQSLFYAPLAIIQQVLAVVPVIGRPLFFLVAFCSLIPTTTSLKAAHAYSTSRALMTWLTPILLNVIVAYAIMMIISYESAS